MEKFRIATFNANSIRTRAGIILDWLEKEAPDVLCVQETKCQDKDFPVAAFEEAGYNAAFFGQKSYNGVAILSRGPLESVKYGFGDGAEEPEQARLIAGTFHGIRIINSYVPQGFEPGSEKFDYKLEWMRRLKAYLEKHHTPGEPIVWTGDMNVAPEAIDVHDPEGLAGHCGFHPDEQAEFQKVVDWGFTDIFRKHTPEPGQYTFWDYRLPNALKRGLGWRIDHILATQPLAEKSIGCRIDTHPRTLPKPSDHTFLAAEFNI
ncbi:MAG TPA: exodeoxyribonuclease III [bacterium]|nr:exodeoxyribonuclease III [bacterium]